MTSRHLDVYLGSGADFAVAMYWWGFHSAHSPAWRASNQLSQPGFRRQG